MFTTSLLQCYYCVLLIFNMLLLYVYYFFTTGLLLFNMLLLLLYYMFTTCYYMFTTYLLHVCYFVFVYFILILLILCYYFLLLLNILYHVLLFLYICYGQTPPLVLVPSSPYYLGSLSWTSRTFYFPDSRYLLEVLRDFLGRERGGPYLPDPRGSSLGVSLSAKEVL